MSDWLSNFELGVSGSLSVASEGSPAAEFIAAIAGAFNGSSSSWGTASRAQYIPVAVRQTTKLYGAYWVNGLTVSGNVDVGLYDSSRSRVLNIGSTAQAGVSALQAVGITTTTIAPGLYYLAMVIDNATATVARASSNAITLSACGLAQQNTAFPLPSTATFAVNAIAIVPMFGFFIETAIF